MDEFPTKIADFLEDTAKRIRAMTVDRLRGAAKWTAFGFVLAVLGLLMVIFLFIGLFRILGELIGVRTAYAAFGGLFLLIGAFLWSARIASPDDEEGDDD